LEPGGHPPIEGFGEGSRKKSKCGNSDENREPSKKKKKKKKKTAKKLLNVPGSKPVKGRKSNDEEKLRATAIRGCTQVRRGKPYDDWEVPSGETATKKRTIYA